MTMKVLHIIGSLKLGGAQVSVKYLVEHCDTEKIVPYLYPLRGREIDIPVDGTIIKYPYRNYDPRKFLAILKICKKYNIDIIHAHLHKPIIAGLLASYFCRAKIIVHERGPIFRRGLQYSLYRFLLRLLHHRASLIIANSQATARCLMQRAKIPQGRIKVIYNAVDFDNFDRRRISGGSLRAQLGIAAEDVIIGYVGRLDYVKGVDLLVEAMALLLKESPRYQLVLLGEGSQRQVLQDRARGLGIADHVQFLGFRNDVSHVMVDFDIGVMPSRQESFGIVALEIMRMKIPMVASGVEGLAELVDHEQNALVPSHNTPQEIAECIRRLVGDADLREKLIDNAYRFTEGFGVSQCVNAVWDAYMEIRG